MQNKGYINSFLNKNQYIQRSEPNIMINHKLINNNKEYNIGNKNMSNNILKNINRYSNNNFQNYEIFDVRIYFCLKMLGLSHLQNIFENNNINFDDLLVLSMKDLENLGITKQQQIIIKKFSLDYIKKASFYTIDELQNYFKKIKNISGYSSDSNINNYRKTIINNNINNNNAIFNNYIDKKFKSLSEDYNYSIEKTNIIKNIKNQLII